MHHRRAKEPFPDPYYRPPQWPPLMVHPLDQYGLPDYDKLPFKPKIQPWMLNNVRRAAPSMGKIVGKSKAVLWMLNPSLAVLERSATSSAASNQSARAGP